MWSCQKKLDILYRSQSALDAFKQRSDDVFPPYTEVFKVYNVTQKQPLQFKKNRYFYKNLKVNKWLRVPLEQLLVETKNFNCDYYIDMTNVVDKQFLKAELRKGKNVIFIENIEFLPQNPQFVDPEDASVMLIRIGKSVYNFYKNVARNIDSELSGEDIQVSKDSCDSNYDFFKVSDKDYRILVSEGKECFISNDYAYIQANVHNPEKNDIIYRNSVFKSETDAGNIIFTESFIEPGKNAQTFYIKSFSTTPFNATLQVNEEDKYFIKNVKNDSYLCFKKDSFIKLSKSGKNILWSSRIEHSNIYYFKYTDIENSKVFYILSYIEYRKPGNVNEEINGEEKINNALGEFKRNKNLKPSPVSFERFLRENVKVNNESVDELMQLSRDFPHINEESRTRRGHLYSRNMLFMDTDLNFCCYSPIIFEENEEYKHEDFIEEDVKKDVKIVDVHKGKPGTPDTLEKGKGISTVPVEPIPMSSFPVL